MPATLEDEWAYWDAKATELRRTQLSSVQSAAAKWSGLLTAALGIFSAIAFAGGLTTIDKLDNPYAGWAKALTSVAALADLAAIILFAIIAGGLTLAAKEGLTAQTVRKDNAVAADSLLPLLTWGRVAVFVAAVAVLAGSAMVLWAPQASSDPSSVVVVTDAHLYCGELTANTDGSVTVGDVAPAGTVTQVVPVEKCP